MNKIKSLTMTSLLAISTIALSACGGSDDGEVTSSEPLPNVEAPAGTEWRDVVAKTEENGYIIGNPEAPIKLVEYVSLTCNACAAFEQEAYSEIIKEYVGSGRVNFEIRNYTRSPYDMVLGILTRCGPTESYPALTEQVLKNQATILNDLQTIDPAIIQAALTNAAAEGYGKAASAMNFLSFFQERGISEDQANSCLADKGIEKDLVDLTERGNKEYKVAGTPSFYINDAKVDYSGWANLKGKLQEAGAR